MDNGVGDCIPVKEHHDENQERPRSGANFQETLIKHGCIGETDQTSTTEQQNHTNFSLIHQKQAPLANYYSTSDLGYQLYTPMKHSGITEYKCPAELPLPVLDISVQQAPVTDYYTTEGCEYKLKTNPSQEHQSKVTDYENPTRKQENQMSEDEDDIYGDVAEDDYAEIN